VNIVKHSILFAYESLAQHVIADFIVSSDSLSADLRACAIQDVDIEISVGRQSEFFTLMNIY
jgi:hypothetical protein